MYEQFYEQGFQIIPNVLDSLQVSLYKKKILDVYQLQTEEIGLYKLKSIQEENVARSPFLYDQDFIEIFYNKHTKTIVNQILGEYAILSLQNAIFVPPNKKHHQSKYHRDIIHQDFVSSRPLGINLYYCLDDYSEINGGTTFIPRSHKEKAFPKTFKEIVPEVSAGSVILFDSMIYHKAGQNLTENIRFGINNMYTLPFIKQQIAYPSCISKYDDPKLNRMLGFESLEHKSVKQFRNFRLQRVNNE